ncbi:hypothetical protein GCM10009733_065720 [Nonomuraea maheshkhaliensis]|uniref:Uncharacterized protein n=1 Tax=Nonomuraea maheshkhaliensis TaxID=419590 RepID=A0ABP4RV41_9ACTN
MDISQFGVICGDIVLFGKLQRGEDYDGWIERVPRRRRVRTASLASSSLPPSQALVGRLGRPMGRTLGRPLGRRRLELVVDRPAS